MSGIGELLNRRLISGSAQKNAFKRAIWIAWERHRRTIELCHHFAIEPILLSSSLPRALKHPYFIVKTMICLVMYRPKILFVQNPSIVLTLMACILHPIMRYKLVVDAHNAGLEPLDRRFRSLKKMYQFFQREADITIVTNHELESVVHKNGGFPFVLPDKVPAAPASKGIELRSKHNIAYICTFSDDEPYRQVIESAKYLPKDVTIYITGNSNKLNPEIKQMTPENIVFTGFISEREYWELLSSVDAIIALTDRQNCLLCGAYEAVAVGKPIILTNTTALKQFFHKGCVYTLNDERSISRGILNALANIETLLDDISALKDELDDSWLSKASKFQKRLN